MSSVHSPPLQVLVCGPGADPESEPFRESIVRAFRGGDDGAGAYLADGADLGVDLREFRRSPGPADRADALLDSALHSLVVILADDSLLRDAAFLAWLNRCGEIATGGDPDDDDFFDSDAPEPRHRVMVLELNDKAGDRLRADCPALAAVQGLYVGSLGERAVRPALAGLVAVHLARVALAGGVPPQPGESDPAKLTFFVSHAKMDAQPIAFALAELIGRVPALKTFYDANDIPPGSDFRKALWRGVHRSVLIVLRSEGYESRPWCRQEIHWAEECACPLVVVDLRARLVHPPSTLTLDQAPTARIPDGNLLRVLFLAVREGLRAGLLRRRVANLSDHGKLPPPGRVRVLPKRPGMLALSRAARFLAKTDPSAPGAILYPDPPLPDAEGRAAEALVASIAPAVFLRTPESLHSDPLSP